jgi:hypothetical protein
MVSNADIAVGGAGLRNVNECGLFRSDDDARVAGTSDEDETAALAMAWTPSPGRGGVAEIDAAGAAPVVTEV